MKKYWQSYSQLSYRDGQMEGRTNGQSDSYSTHHADFADSKRRHKIITSSYLEDVQEEVYGYQEDAGGESRQQNQAQQVGD